MELTDLLKPCRVIPSLGGLTLRDIYSEMLSLITDKTVIKNKEDILAELLEREDEVSSEITDGIAVPHIRLGKLKKFEIVIGLSSKGINHPSDWKKLHLFFLELAPRSENNKHIFLLAELVKLIEIIDLKSFLDKEVTGESLCCKLIELNKTLN